MNQHNATLMVTLSCDWCPEKILDKVFLSKKDFAGSTNQTKFYERDASFAGF
jgi:hypothetical protein